MSITRAFMVGGSDGTGLPTVVYVGVEGKQRWHRDVMPTLKKAIQQRAGRKVPWSDIFVWGLGEFGLNGDEASYFEEEREKRRNLLIVLHPDRTFTFIEPKEPTP